MATHKTGYYVWVGSRKHWFRVYSAALAFYLKRSSQLGTQVVSLTDWNGDRAEDPGPAHGGYQNPSSGFNAQVRRLPDGRVQIKIPLGAKGRGRRNPVSIEASDGTHLDLAISKLQRMGERMLQHGQTPQFVAQAVRRALGNRVESAVIVADDGQGHRAYNPRGRGNQKKGNPGKATTYFVGWDKQVGSTSSGEAGEAQRKTRAGAEKLAKRMSEFSITGREGWALVTDSNGNRVSDWKGGKQAEIYRF